MRSPAQPSSTCLGALEAVKCLLLIVMRHQKVAGEGLATFLRLPEDTLVLQVISLANGLPLSLPPFLFSSPSLLLILPSSLSFFSHSSLIVPVSWVWLTSLLSCLSITQPVFTDQMKRKPLSWLILAPL